MRSSTKGLESVLNDHTARVNSLAITSDSMYIVSGNGITVLSIEFKRKNTRSSVTGGY